MMGAIVSKDERIDLKHLEEDALMQDLNWSIARFEQVETLVRDMIAELKRMYELEDKLRTVITTLDFEYGIAAKLLGEVEPASE